MSKKVAKEKAGQGPDLSKVDLSKVDVEQVKKWLVADVQRCISLLVCVLDNVSIQDEMADALYTKFKQQQSLKEAEGKL